MAIAKWAAPGNLSAELAGTTLNSLASNGTSAFVTYDNSTNLDLFALVRINLGSISPGTNGTITLRVFATQATNAPDNTGSVGGGDMYTVPLTTGASAKAVIIPMIRLYPFSMRLCITNNAGVALAASGNTMYLQPFNESVI